MFAFLRRYRLCWCKGLRNLGLRLRWVWLGLLGLLGELEYRYSSVLARYITVQNSEYSSTDIPAPELKSILQVAVPPRQC